MSKSNVGAPSGTLPRNGGNYLIEREFDVQAFCGAGGCGLDIRDGVDGAVVFRLSSDKGADEFFGCCRSHGGEAAAEELACQKSMEIERRSR